MPTPRLPPLPLQHARDQAQRGQFLQAVKVVVLGLVYIAVSAALIAFNKYLIHEDRFPFAVPLVWLHALFSSIFSVVLYFCCPSLYPCLTDPERKVEIDRWLIMTGAVPIAAFFSVQLILSNAAYLHLSVAFLQMVKESNLIFTYIFSLVLYIERFSWRNTGILCFLLFATSMTITGELRFSWVGFLIALTGQIFESAKIVMQSQLLSPAGRKLDALTYVLLVMPCCLVLIGIVMLCLHLTPTHHLPLPTWGELHEWWPYLAANASLAFCLNVSVALLVKQASAMGFILTGITKDVCIVLVGCFFLSELVSFVQAIGFALQMSAIGLWSAVKMFPGTFEAGIVAGLAQVICPKFCAKKTDEEDAVGVPFATPAAASYGGQDTIGGAATAQQQRTGGKESAMEG